MTGTINANAGTIGGFVIGQGRIGSTATGTGSGGGLAIYDDLFRVGGHHFVCPVRQQHHTGIRRRIMCHRTYCEQQGEQHL